jgi:cyclic beta-1,2-glucan synthetase
VWRMLVSHKRLLEWRPSSVINRTSRNGISSSFRLMWIAPVIAVFIGITLVITRPETLATAVPFLLLWLVSPAIAWWISLPTALRVAKITPDQILFLRFIARKTWGYFETFVGPEDHWLPPDNFQEYHGVGVAHRTSPTNMGLGLLANLSAYDFGYIPIGILLKRTNNTLGTMADLEKYHGHFYNGMTL